MIMSNLGDLISRKDHPVYIPYGGSVLVISPRGKIQKVNGNKLGALPKNVVFIFYKIDK